MNQGSNLLLLFGKLIQRRELPMPVREIGDVLQKLRQKVNRDSRNLYELWSQANGGHQFLPWVWCSNNAPD